MKTNRDLLKEAIADAKAVKETAITNAKAALEEAFTPHLKELFASKLEEMENIDEEEVDEMMSKDEKMEEAEKSINEMNIDELLSELNEAEEEAEDDEVEVSDMSEDDLKTFIEDVIKDMVSAGELEAGKEEAETEEETESEETKEDEEVDLDELLAEVESMEEEAEMNEFLGTAGKKIGKILGQIFTNPLIKAYEKAEGKIDPSKSTLKDTINKFKNWAKTEYDDTAINAAMSEIRQQFGKNLPTGSLMKRLGTGTTGVTQQTSENLELQEAYSTIKTLKRELHEINLLNAKLLYTNKIFKAKNLTDPQKVKVLESFDKATTVKEVKLVFETLTESLNSNKKNINESRVRGFASKTTAPVVNNKQPIIESNDAFLRMQKLAGLR